MMFPKRFVAPTVTRITGDALKRYAAVIDEIKRDRLCERQSVVNVAKELAHDQLQD